MRVKRLVGTGGIGIVYNVATHSIIFAFCNQAVRISFPRIDACKFCGHGPELHAAAKTGGMIEWSCHGNKATCECEHYTPVGR